MGATAVEEEFLRQSEWAARERKAPTGTGSGQSLEFQPGKGGLGQKRGGRREGELETRRKWPKSRVSARKGGFGPEEGGAT